MFFSHKHKSFSIFYISKINLIPISFYVVPSSPTRASCKHEHAPSGTPPVQRGWEVLVQSSKASQLQLANSATTSARSWLATLLRGLPSTIPRLWSLHSKKCGFWLLIDSFFATSLRRTSRLWMFTLLLMTVMWSSMRCGYKVKWMRSRHQGLLSKCDCHVFKYYHCPFVFLETLPYSLKIHV